MKYKMLKLLRYLFQLLSKRVKEGVFVIQEQYHKSNTYNQTRNLRMQLTRRRLLLLRETEPFLQIVGTDPGFKRRSLPFTCTERVKLSLVK